MKGSAAAVAVLLAASLAGCGAKTARTESGSEQAEHAARVAAKDLLRRVDAAMNAGLSQPDATSVAVKNRRAVVASTQLDDAQAKLARLQHDRDKEAAALAGVTATGLAGVKQRKTIGQVIADLDDQIKDELKKIHALAPVARKAAKSVIDALLNGFRGAKLINPDMMLHAFLNSIKGVHSARLIGAMTEKMLEFVRHAEKTGLMPPGSVEKIARQLGVALGPLGPAFANATDKSIDTGLQARWEEASRSLDDAALGLRVLKPKGGAE